MSDDVRAAFGGHHLWCNGSSRAPVKGCRWCDPDGDGKRGLWALYPYDTGAEANNLHTKHFPAAVERTSWDTLSAEDRELDHYIAGWLLSFLNYKSGVRAGSEETPQ